jgi:hypothetical protein
VGGRRGGMSTIEPMHQADGLQPKSRHTFFVEPKCRQMLAANDVWTGGSRPGQNERVT